MRQADGRNWTDDLLLHLHLHFSHTIGIIEGLDCILRIPCGLAPLVSRSGALYIRHGLVHFVDVNRNSGFTAGFPVRQARDKSVLPWSCSTTELHRQSILLFHIFNHFTMPPAGFEPARVAPHGPKPCASANFATEALSIGVNLAFRHLPCFFTVSKIKQKRKTLLPGAPGNGIKTIRFLQKNSFLTFQTIVREVRKEFSEKKGRGERKKSAGRKYRTAGPEKLRKYLHDSPCR